MFIDEPGRCPDSTKRKNAILPDSSNDRYNRWKILAGQFLVSTPAARKAMACLRSYHLQHLPSTGNIPPTSPLPPRNRRLCRSAWMRRRGRRRRGFPLRISARAEAGEREAAGRFAATAGRAVLAAGKSFSACRKKRGAEGKDTGGIGRKRRAVPS